MEGKLKIQENLQCLCNTTAKSTCNCLSVHICACSLCTQEYFKEATRELSPSSLNGKVEHENLGICSYATQNNQNIM